MFLMALMAATVVKSEDGDLGLSRGIVFQDPIRSTSSSASCSRKRLFFSPDATDFCSKFFLTPDASLQLNVESKGKHIIQTLFSQKFKSLSMTAQWDLSFYDRMSYEPTRPEELEISCERQKSKANIEELRGSLMDKETELQCVLEENEVLNAKLASLRGIEVGDSYRNIVESKVA
ncbi:hypothetical protein LXL04_028165 [Taraxacum kok-saghyz]